MSEKENIVNDNITVSADDFNETVNASCAHEEPVHVDWNGLDLIIKPRLSLQDALLFANTCTDACFSESDGAYVPFHKDIAIQSCIILLYTNINLPDDLSLQYDLIRRSGVLSEVYNRIDIEQLNHILTAIDMGIEHRARVNASSIELRLNELSSVMENMERSMSSLFGDVSAEELHGVLSSLSSGKFDEEKIVSEYLKQTNKE